MENSAPIGNKAPFYTLLFAITKMFIFGSSCRIQSDNDLPSKDLNLPNK